MSQNLFKVVADGFIVHIIAKDEHDAVSLCESCFDFSNIYMDVVKNRVSEGIYPRFASLSEVYD